MALRRGNVDVNPATINAGTPEMPEDGNGMPPPMGDVAAPPPPVAAVAVAAVAPETTAPVEQARAIDAAATQVAPAAAPVTTFEPPIQAPATVDAGGGALTTSAMGGDLIQELANDGFEGLEFGFGTFPMVTLQNDGSFELGGNVTLGTQFYCTILGSQSKWVYSNNQKGPLSEAIYSMDRVHDNAGDPIEKKLSEWRDKGWTPVESRYVDVQAQMVTDDDHNGELVVLSVSPSSVKKLSGYIATVKRRHGLDPKNVITRCSLGDKVTKVAFPFFPWAFSLHQG